MKTLEEGFVDELKDILSAEKQLTKALPKMAKKASNPELKAGIEAHLEETKHQIERIEQCFEELGLTARAKTCEAMKGLLTEADEHVGDCEDPDLCDAMIIACSQKVEHYEIATYGTLCTWADLLGYSNIKKILGETLNEEEKTDKKLSQLSKKVNIAAKA